jgi:general secretion pathway protein G
MKLLRIIAIVIPAFCCAGREPCNARSGTKFARESVLRHDLLEMRKAIHDYHEDKKRWPESVDALVRSKYLRLPQDPMTGSDSTWIPVRHEGALIDIRSGASGKSCDGTLYQSW